MARRIRYAENRPVHPSHKKREKGELSVSYLGVAVLTAGIAATLIGSGVGGNVASATKTAVCSVTKGDCDTADAKPATAAKGPTDEGDNSLTTMQGTGKNPFASSQAPDPTTQSLTQPAGRQEVETSPEIEQVKQFLRDRDWTITNKPGYNQLANGKRIWLDPGATAKNQVRLYIDAVSKHYDYQYGVRRNEWPFDPRSTPMTITPSGHSRKEYIQEKTDELANPAVSRIRTRQEVLKLNKYFPNSVIMGDTPYLDVYEAAYDDAVNNKVSWNGSATQLVEIGAHAGHEAIKKEIRKEYGNEKLWGEDWDRNHWSPKKKSKSWWCLKLC